MVMTRPGYSKPYRRPSGRYQLEVWWYERGQRFKVKKGTYLSMAAGEKAGKQWIADVLAGEAAAPSPETVGGWIDVWLALCTVAGLRPTTTYSHRSMLSTHVRPTVGHLALQELEATHIDAIYAAMSDRGLSVATIRRMHAVIRKLLGDARRKGLVATNVADDASPPRARLAKGSEREVWTAPQVGQFLDSLDGHPHQAILHTLATTGVRRSEACVLRWSAVDLAAGWLEVREGLTETPGALHIHGPKTARGFRRVDLDPGTVEMLRAHRRRQFGEMQIVGAGYRDEGFVFARPDGQPWKPTSISAAYRRLVASIGLPPIALHDLRHTHASLMLASRTELNVVADRLGHASAAFTLSTYGHSMPGRQAEAANRVAELVPRRARTEPRGSTRDSIKRLSPELSPEGDDPPAANLSAAP